METITYTLIIVGVITLFFFAIFFREPPRISKK